MGNRGDAGVGLRLGESFQEEISGDEGGDRKHLQLAERIESKVIQDEDLTPDLHTSASEMGINAGEYPRSTIRRRRDTGCK